MPILVTLFGGIIELSSYISRSYVVQRAARDGARVGAVTIEGVDPTGDDIEAAAIAQAQVVLEETGKGLPDGTSITADWELAEDGWYYINVSITYPYDAFTQVLPYLETVDIQADFVMMTQQQ